LSKNGDQAVVAQVRHLLQTREIITRTWAAARRELQMPEREVVATITNFEPLWDELFPAEQARIVRLLVERVELAPDGIQVQLRAEGLQTLVEDLQSREAKAA
jgi:site-specific DNA recombinase